MTGIASSAFSFLFLGFLLGMRHATDADHVVAIATIVSRARSLAGSALIGAAWGVGHTVMVMAVGAAIILFGVVIPPKLGLSMEFAVGIMLVLLGVLTLTGMGRTIGAAHSHAHSGIPSGHDFDLHDHLHTHGDYVHQHPHGHSPGAHGHAEEHTPLARLDRSWLGRIALYEWLRPFAVGLVHGLAGSAAVALMVLSIIREPMAAIGYLLLFGFGTIAGMMLITLILSAPFAFTAVSLPRFNWQLRVASGLVSFLFGMVLIYGIGFAEGGLFTDAPNWNPR
jgi:high-affinity nickel-transport protein